MGMATAARVFDPAIPRRYTPVARHLEAAMQELRDGLSVLERGRAATKENPSRCVSIGELIALDGTSTADSYPRSVRAFDGRVGSVIDDDGNPMPPLRDPVGELVVRCVGPNLRAVVAAVNTMLAGARDAATILVGWPDAHAPRCSVADILDELHDVVDLIDRRFALLPAKDAAVFWSGPIVKMVTGVRAAVAALARACPPPPAPPEPGCSVLERYGAWEPVFATGRGQWSYQLWHEFGADPPGSLVQAHLDGRRITARMIAVSYELPLAEVEAILSGRRRRRRVTLHR